MKNSLSTKRLYTLLGWTLLGLLLVLLALEGWRYAVKPSKANNQQLVQKELATAAKEFTAKQRELLKQSEDLASTLQPPLLQDRPPNSLYRLLPPTTDFWSISLYQDKQPIIWQGFALQNRTNEPFSAAFEPEIALRKENNTIYWECRVPFSLKKDDQDVWYQLFTRFRIEQNNPLSIGSKSEFNFFQSGEISSSYPLNFSLFNTPPDDMMLMQQLNNLSGDSVGVVYATTDKFEQTEVEWDQNTRFWRSVFAVFCFVVLVFFFFGAVDRISWNIGLLMQIFFIGIGWLVFTYTDMLARWILTLTELTGTSQADTVRQLSAIFINATFALLAAIALTRKLPFFSRKFRADSYLNSIATACIFGVTNALTIPQVLSWVYQSAIIGHIPVLDLRILPEQSSVFLYLIIGLSLLALGIFLIALNRLLFRATRDHLKLSVSVLTISFFIGLFFTQLFIPQQLVLGWVFFTSICFFAVISGIALGYAQNINWICSLSPLRKVILGSMLIAGLSIPILYQAYLTNLDEELISNARQFAKKENQQAEELTRTLLEKLEQRFRSTTYSDLQDNQTTLQAQFTQTIQDFLAPKWSTYSFDLQLVSTSEELIASYSTNLNSPNWLNIYNLSSLEVVTEIQQITKSTIRPIVQQPQLINQEDYSTFYRGWIPVFGTSDHTPIAWILCSVYKERPQFNKPIRAVMASLSYDDWNNAFLMQKYEDGKLTNTTQQGFAGYFPKYQQLQDSQLKRLQSDSLFYFTDRADEYVYRTLLWKSSDTETIKISSSLADYRVILFAFFRYSFTLLIAGFLFLLIAQLLSWGRISFMGRNKRFQDRILDSFLLATLIFLGFLIATSHFAIKQQNQEIVRQELFDKLERLSKSVETNNIRRNNLSFSPSSSLESLTAALNVDATFYTDRKVSKTTTPQIYQQHLLPAALPFNIYNQLYIQQQRDAYSTVNLANQPLLIGYRSILNEDKEPVATIAIPTFLESPKYDQQLLETTSYLILAYLLVFGLFIIGSVFISKSLTRPLTNIQDGLNKISDGNLDTTIPVTGKDEIGNLAKAYNEMVFRLKKLQKELAEAEREAAWKEMAQQVAHEIKNPLTPMKLNVQHLERQLKTDKYEGEKLKKHIQKITGNLIDQIQSLSTIASDFSKFSQPIDKDFTTVNLGTILSSVAQLYQHDEQLKIHFREPESPIKVKGIADDLKRVFINIVKNAYEAMDEDGKISITLYEQQSHAFIEIEDNGNGIPEENRSNIFVPNFSTKSGGTGLGLAICKKIIEAHDGSISFASVEGEGTTFVIKLPQMQP